MLDLHCHILPGIDDGPESWEESLALCRLMLEQGISTTVATPHYWPGMYEPETELITDRVRELNQRLERTAMPLRVLAGSEVLLCPELLELIRQHKVLTLNHSRYLLLELPQLMPKEQLFEVLFALQLQGLVPVIAHPEKNRMIQDSPGLMAELVRKGALGQITASSLLDAAPQTIRVCADRLLDRRNVQLMASDAHSCQNRPPLLQAGLESASARLNSRREAEDLVCERPEYILQDRALRIPEPRQSTAHSKNRLFSFIRRTCKKS